MTINQRTKKSILCLQQDFDGFLLVATSTPLEALLLYLVAACMCSSYASPELSNSCSMQSHVLHTCCEYYIQVHSIIQVSGWVSDANWVVNCS